MHTVYDWHAKRAGPGMTIYGKTDAGDEGEVMKAVGVDVIGLQPLDGGDTGVVAVGRSGERYLLAVPLGSDGTRALCDRIRDVLDVGSGDQAKDDNLAPAKLKDIRRLLDRTLEGAPLGAVSFDSEERATVLRLLDWAHRSSDSGDAAYLEKHKALLVRIGKKIDPNAFAGFLAG